MSSHDGILGRPSAAFSQDFDGAATDDLHDQPHMTTNQCFSTYLRQVIVPHWELSL